MIITHIVTAGEAGMTLQQLLRGPMALSGRQTRNAKAQGAVTVNAAPFFSNQRVQEGMVVRVVLYDYAPADKKEPPKNAPSVKVVYEDDALLAVFKPALLQCHPSPSAPGGSDTLESRVHAYLGTPAHPVHRLDSETTGIVLFAKLPYAQAHLQQQMQAGTFKKTYRAWVIGRPDPSAGLIDAPIDPENPDSFTRIVTPSGQRAVSRYETLKTLPLASGGCASLLALSPVTGRTHQLRVHMAHIGCPLLGDQRYFTEASRSATEALHLTYHQLSAVTVRFIHPSSKASICISCDPEFSFLPE